MYMKIQKTPDDPRLKISLSDTPCFSLSPSLEIYIYIYKTIYISIMLTLRLRY